jgi:tetratricopeptide (TPR) repeat protein
MSTRLQAYLSREAQTNVFAAPASVQTQQHDLAQFEQARALHQQGLLHEAEELYRALLLNHPGHSELLHQLGMVHGQRNQLVAAIEFIDQAIAADPNNAAAHGSRGNCLKGLGKQEEALASYDRALALQPNDANIWSNRGATLGDLKRHAEALESYDRALALDPHHVPALDNRGTTLRALQRLEEALASHDRALAINPEYASAHYNRGLTLADLKMLEEARESYHRALAVNPNYSQALSNLGVVLFELKQFDKALASYEHAIRISPDHADTHVNLSVCLLQLGDFARGWVEFEWRWHTAEYRERVVKVSAPAWAGEKLRGSLLVWNEHGVGDEIFYAGMLNELKPYAKLITVCVDFRLVTLFQRSFGNMQVLSRQTLAPDMRFDAHIPMGSLGRHLRRSFSTFPKVVKPYLFACPTRTRDLRANIAQEKRLICGLSWSSKSVATGSDKSLQLQELEPVLAMRGIEFVDLQYGDTAQEQAAFYATTGLGLKRVAEIDNFSDLDGLTALIEACDVVVTVSNTTAHLAGALGKPVLLMLPFSHGLMWYWHLEREDSPWYPTVKIFRQREIGNWRHVIENVGRALERQRVVHLESAIVENRSNWHL